MGSFQRLLQPRTPFGEVAAYPPEPPQRNDKAQLQLGIAARVSMIESKAQVVPLLLEHVKPAKLFRPAQLGGLGQIEKVAGVGVCNALALRARGARAQSHAPSRAS